MHKHIEPKSIRKIFTESFRLYGSTFLAALPFTLLAWILSNAPMIFVELDKIPTFSKPFHLLLVILTWTLLILFPFVMAWVMAAMVLRVQGAITHTPKSISTATSYAWKKFPQYCITGIVFLIIVTVGTILCIIPGIFLAILLCFYFLCILMDGDDVVASLSHSARLVWGHWWRTLGIFVLMAIIYIGVSGIISLAMGLPTWILFTKYAPHPKMFSFQIAHWTNGIIYLICAAWHISVFILVYHDLKIRANEPIHFLSTELEEE